MAFPSHFRPFGPFRLLCMSVLPLGHHLLVTTIDIHRILVCTWVGEYSRVRHSIRPVCSCTVVPVGRLCPVPYL